MGRTRVQGARDGGSGMKAVLLLSGGIDSTVVAYQLAHWGRQVHAISFHYGQTHQRELKFAQRTADKLYFRHSQIHMSRPFGSSVLTGAGTIPEGLDQSVVVPGRNLIFLSYALAIALQDGAEAIYIGATADDAEVFPDCRHEFIDAFQQVASFADDRPVPVLNATFVNETKVGVIQAGELLGVPWEATYSCYRGKEKHCGRCGACAARSQAFEALEVTDPTTYNRNPLVTIEKAGA